MDVIPNTVVGAFAQGEVLQVLFSRILFAFGLQTLGERGEVPLRHRSGQPRAVRGRRHHHEGAPIGAFGAMAFTIGKYGVATLCIACAISWSRST